MFRRLGFCIVLVLLAVLPTFSTQAASSGSFTSIIRDCEKDTVSFSFSFTADDNYERMVVFLESDVVIDSEEYEYFQTVSGSTYNGSDAFALTGVDDSDALTITLYDGPNETDLSTVNIPACSEGETEIFAGPGCSVGFPILSTATVTTAQSQIAYSWPEGEPARRSKSDSANIILPLDFDKGGIDEYLVIDKQTDSKGNLWLGLYIGSCNPVYVPASQVTLTRDLK